MMDDLIRRQVATDAPEIFIKDCNPEHFVGHEKFIEYMDNVEIGSFGNWQFANGFNMGLTAAEVAIKKLPSAHQWIPLSTNHLPKEGQKVLIQFKDGRQCPHFKVQVVYLGVHDVEDNNFVKIGEKSVWYTNQYYYDLDMVVAWMPIPELYKESNDVSITD